MIAPSLTVCNARARPVFGAVDVLISAFDITAPFERDVRFVNCLNARSDFGEAVPAGDRASM